ncbi:sigma factor [Streptomyces uncialis]|uniref:sigma factor n=1 Tax=Streptomyces uncialis TaxID=1048205 RepID=UPI0038267CC9
MNVTVTVTDDQITAAQAGDADAMWEIVSALDPMLRGIVRQVAPGASSEDVDDMIQEARAVVIQHVHTYTTGATSAALTSYVYRAVRRAIAELRATSESALNVPATAAIRVKHSLWAADGDRDQAWELVNTGSGATHQMKRETFLAVVCALQGAESLDTPAGSDGDDGLTLSDVLPDSVASVTERADRRDLARWLMTQIAPRQSLALRAFYGVGMTRQEDPETAHLMGITAPALRQLRTRGVQTARTVATRHGLAA